MDHAPLNLRHLRVFRELARLKSASATAASEHLTQSAVTQAIAGLERKIGIKLFERRSDGMYLAQEGADFLFRVDRALEHLRRGAQDALRLGNRQGSRGFPRFDRLLTMAQLRALVVMSEARNFSLAARQAGLSQPSLHRAARHLEALSGLTLFKSAPEGVSLTLPAQELARRASLAFAELQQGLDHIRATLGRDSTHITIGSLPLARTSIVPLATTNLIAACPGVKVRIIEGQYEKLLERLRRGEIDILVGALRLPAPVKDIRQEALFDDPLEIVVGAGHPLVGKTDVTLDDTLRFPWVASPDTTPAGLYLRRILRLDEGALDPVSVTTSSSAVLRGILGAGPFVSVVSRHQARYEIESGLIVPLPIVLPDSLRTIGMTVRADWRPTPTQQRCIEMIRSAALEPTNCAEVRSGEIARPRGPMSLPSVRSPR